MLTDIMSCFGLKVKGGRDTLWPLVLAQAQLWMLGPPIDITSQESDDVSFLDDEYYDPLWRPGEALARVGCKELRRASKEIKKSISKMGHDDVTAWGKLLCSNVSDCLNQNTKFEETIYEEFSGRHRSVIDRSRSPSTTEEEIIGLATPYGRGRVVTRRIDRHKGDISATVMREVTLEWGATLYGPDRDRVKEEGDPWVDAHSDDEGN